ncbi:MoaD/ThiS family protein [Pyrobaculum neutrophilum]|uniref:ThiamineS protein n=1 Tax=Pyrobaculum neutrophilum (strain DSM 2338 / JCM 9278 / NBRC 100436 / V24Sta) TaxID=444157 RepID=B1Y8T8_PYRNV|nr:MoaD/ThiS family protein [Pyrobaculum neutrophilum]ACB40167.1 thiamineS protein [Pyrobaculum neutrophilum V24Sta]
MKVVVKIYGPKYFGIDRYDVVTEVLEVDGEPTVMDVLDKLEGRYPGLKRRLLSGDVVAPMHDVLINGRSIAFLRGLTTALKDGDVVQIVPPFGG